MFSSLLAVLKKEMLDAVRDAKSLAPGLIMPLVFALTTYGMVQFLVGVQEQPEAFDLPIAGAERAAPLMAALREAGINPIRAPEDPVAAVRARRVDMALIIPDDFSEQFRQQKPADLDLVWDISRTDVQSRVQRVRQHLGRWSTTTGSLRLLLRGVSPEVSQVLSLNDVNVASSEKMASRLFASLPIVVLLMAFIAGAGMSSEMAAGERENHTLEPLLAQPVSAYRLFAGKWLAAVVVTVLFATLGVLLQFVAVGAAPLEQLGLRTDLSAADFWLVMVVLLPIIFMATALQLFVSFLSKSFKDAQTYNQLLVLLPLIPGIYILVGDASVTTWKLWVPLLGPQLLFTDIFSGQSVQAVSVFIVSVSSLVVAAVFALAGARLMARG